MEAPNPPPSLPTEPQQSRHFQQPQIPSWRLYIHLYAPLITTFLLPIFKVQFPPQLHLPSRLLFGLLTYLIASIFYPTNLAPPKPEDSTRFTHKTELHRAAVLFTYSRIFGTPFNLQFFITDFLSSYGVGYFIGEREPENPRRSEFFVHVLWVCASSVVQTLVPANYLFYVLLIDRALWREAYLALVDDVVKVLMHPDTGSWMGWRGKGVLVLVQSAVITILGTVIQMRGWILS